MWTKHTVLPSVEFFRITKLMSPGLKAVNFIPKSGSDTPAFMTCLRLVLITAVSPQSVAGRSNLT